MPIADALADPAVRQIYLTAFLAGLSVVVMCGLLSVLVVVKKLGFVGQGVSHSAFGGIGVAAVLAAMGLAPDGGPVQLAVVVLFCVAAALGMAAVSDRRTVPADTAIGIFLVGSMALGAILVQEARGIAERSGRSVSVQSWESILFGSIITADQRDVAVGWSIAALVIAVAWIVRRPLLFWAFDEEGARAFGVPAGAVKITLMVLLSLAVVVAMKLAGVVLATALLVLPGSTALKLSSRLFPAVAISVAVGILGLVIGLLASLRLDWQPGPCVVAVMTALFILAAPLGPPPSPPDSADPKDPRMKAETLLAELDRIRKDLPKDPSDLEWLALHHAFCFISYKTSDFRKYLEEQEKQGAFEQYEG